MTVPSMRRAATTPGMDACPPSPSSCSAGYVPARSGLLGPAECAPELRPVAIDLFAGGYADYHALRRSLTFDPTAPAGIRPPPQPRPTRRA